MREKAVAVLGEVPGQGVVYRQSGVVSGESCYIRERARALGMSMRDLAERVGVTPGYMTEVSRGRRNMGVKVQARVESALEAPAKVAPAQCAGVDRGAVWDRMDPHGLSQLRSAVRGDVAGKAKLSYRWKAAVIERWATSRGRLIREEETGEPFRVPCCPDCTAQVVDKDGVPLTDADLNRRKHVCAACGSPLWQAGNSGPKRYPLSDYVKHRMKGFFDLLIGDECHEFKGRGSAQGIAAGILADACGKSLSLTGTLLGGYASTIFHLLYQFSPEIRTEFGRSDEYRLI